MATAFASQEIAQLLSKGLLFGALDDDARRELAGHAHRRSKDGAAVDQSHDGLSDTPTNGERGL